MRWLAAIPALLLVACATAPPRPAPADWPQRLAALRAIGRFQLDGRMAINTGSDGFSAGVRWRQQDDDATLELSAPLGFGAAQIRLTGGVLYVTDSRGQKLSGDGALAELTAELGFTPPLAQLRFWVLGASAPGSQSIETLDPEQRLSHLEQDGWTVEYADYATLPPHVLPRRLTLQRGSVRLRLVIDTWQF